MIKKIHLTAKELARADDGYTVIRRKQANGKILVAAVHIEEARIVWYAKSLADTKEDVRKAVQEVGRWMDKMGGMGKMFDRSRHRTKA